jgi:hypothetical protein
MISIQSEHSKVVGYHLIIVAQFRDIAFSIMNENWWFKICHALFQNLSHSKEKDGTVSHIRAIQFICNLHFIC